MPRNYINPLLVFSLCTLAHGKNVADCRVLTAETTQCDPYTSKLIHAKEITSASDRKKLIISKTLPVPKNKKVRVISVEELIEKYVKVEDSLRFKRTHDEIPDVEVIEKVVPEDVMPEKVIVQEKVLVKEKMPKEIVPEEPVKQVVQTIPKAAPKKEVLAEKGAEVSEKVSRKEIILGYYTVIPGDSLGKIASTFGLSVKEIVFLNHLDKSKHLKLGQKLRIPLPQKTIDAMATGEYTIEPNDSLITIARMFNVTPKALAEFNNLKTNATIRVGKKLVLPIPYMVKKHEAEQKRAAEKKRLAEKKKREAAKRAKRQKVKMLKGFGKRKMRVTATAYTSHHNQTDKTPFLAAWNNRLRPGMKIIAVSRDMLRRYGMRNGTKVRIGGLRGYYTVRDKMNKRYRKRIDIYMGLDRKRALRWGRRSVVIHW